MSGKVLQQDLSQKEPDGNVFVIHLLMQDKCPVPEKQDVISIMEKHLGDIDCYSYSEESIGFDVKKYPLDFDGKTAYPMLMLTNCFLNEKLSFDELTRSQMWDCPESDEIIARCHNDVVAVDMLSAYMDYKDRADMLMDFTEALMELYPTCEAVYFDRSGKMFTKQAILEHSIPRKDRFIYFAVNVRFFNIEGSGDMLIDSLGMSELDLPDVQYHFYDLDPDSVVNHAYTVLSYIYENNCPIESGETIDGLKDGRISRDVQWVCQFEEALVQPARTVMDINTLEFAAGKR